METKKLKVGILYNETNPELYIYKEDIEKSNLNFQPYFEIENKTPMEEFEQLAEDVRSLGYEVLCININDNFTYFIEILQKEKFDVVFNFIEIFNGKSTLEMAIAGVYELMGIAYTGAGPLALANCQNKVLTKRLLSANGINTAPYTILSSEEETEGHLRFPLIVKPQFQDASVGIENNSVVRSREELQARVRYVRNEFKEPALVEEYIDGRELNVAVLGDKKLQVLPISEIDFSTMPPHLEKIVSYQAKWDPFHESYHKTIPVCPAQLPEKVKLHVEAIAKKVFRLMDLRDYARVDLRLAKGNKLYVLEVNPNPDLSEGAGFMRSAEAAGYTYRTALGKIIELALERKQHLQKGKKNPGQMF